jgi:hypothetical protein
MTDDLSQRATDRVSILMDEIVANFKPGAKITELVRTPDKPTADFCLTSDSLDEVAAMIRRRQDGRTPSASEQRPSRFRLLYAFPTKPALCLSRPERRSDLAERQTEQWIMTDNQNSDRQTKAEGD